MKHITSRLLALLLTAAMIISMVPAVYAADEDVTIVENEQPTVEEPIVEDATVGPAEAVEANSSEGTTEGTATAVAEVGETSYTTRAGAIAAVIQNGLNVASYTTLAGAIAAAKDGDSVTLLADTTEDVTIDKDITLDLGGNTLTNTDAGKATLTVASDATATVKNGRIVGGKDYYNIAVGTAVNSTAKLTLEDVTATAGNTGSSMIDNWGTLTINSGNYSGGLNVVKSEEGSTLTIKDGTFTLNYATSDYTGVILSAGTTKITGGNFIQNATPPKWSYPQVVLAMQVEGYTSKIEITGGTFTNKKSSNIFHGYTPATSNNFEVSGGIFNKLVTSSFLRDGLVCTKDSATNTYKLVTGATGVTLSKSDITIKVGEKFKLEATLTPENAELKSVTWKENSKEKIATVTNGVVEGVAIGDVIITATPNAAGATPATCKVHVYDEAAQIGETIYPTLEQAIKEVQNGETSSC